MPIWTPSLRDASRAMSSPTRVILNAVCLIASATVCMSAVLGSDLSTDAMTPGPETPTLMTSSPSPLPCTAPAMKGESSTMIEKMTSLAAP